MEHHKLLQTAVQSFFFLTHVKLQIHSIGLVFNAWSFFCLKNEIFSQILYFALLLNWKSKLKFDLKKTNRFKLHFAISHLIK